MWGPWASALNALSVDPALIKSSICLLGDCQYNLVYSSIKWPLPAMSALPMGCLSSHFWCDHSPYLSGFSTFWLGAGLRGPIAGPAWDRNVSRVCLYVLCTNLCLNCNCFFVVLILLFMYFSFVHFHLHFVSKMSYWLERVSPGADLTRRISLATPLMFGACMYVVQVRLCLFVHHLHSSRTVQLL